MAAENNTVALTIALVNAKNISALIEDEISPELRKQVEADSKEIEDILKLLQEQLPDEEKIQQLYDSLSNQVEKNKLAGELAEKVVSLCEQLANIDYTLMEQEEKCNPDTAPTWLKEYIETDIKKMQQEATNKFVEVLKSCVQDIQNCQCQEISVQKMKTYCEKEKKLIILCEFEENEDACEELDSEGEYAGEELLPEFMREKFRKIMDESEDMMFDKFAPKECKDAGAKTREDCEKIMIEKHGEPPKECMEKGKFIGEKQCTEKMIESGEMPEECVADGKFIGEEQCIQKMVDSGKMPKQCMEDGKFIGREECEQKMMDSGDMPEECVKDGRPIGEKACLEKMKKAGKIPQECFDGDEFIGREACEEKFKNQMQGEGGEGRTPEECMKDSEFIGKEECETIMKEKYQQGKGQSQGFPQGEFREGDFPGMNNEGPGNRGRTPEECMKDSEFIGKEECETIMRERYQQRGEQSKGFSGENFQKDEERKEETVGGVIRKIEISNMQQGFPIGENYGQQQHEQQQFNFMNDLKRMQQEGRINIGDRSFESLNPEEIKQLLNDAKQTSPEAPDFTDVQRLQKEIEQLEQDREDIGSRREKENQKNHNNESDDKEDNEEYSEEQESNEENN